MSCCGSKRAALMAKTAYARSQKNLYAQAPQVARIEPSPATGPLVQYDGPGSLSLRGPVSGQVYVFKETGVSSIVHEHDLNALLSTGLFSRVKV